MATQRKPRNSSQLDNGLASDGDCNLARRAETEHVGLEQTGSEVVSGSWLVKAILATMAGAGVALYLTVCLLFYQGQWQFVFFPPRLAANGRAKTPDMFAGSWARRTGPPASSPAATPDTASIAASSGLPITDHRFDYTQEGTAQLDGWWIPAVASTGRSQAPSLKSSAVSPMVLLYCHDGHTNLQGNVAAFRAFHRLGISVFAFDYRGFGASQRTKPSQKKAYADGIAALHYLTGMRHIDPHRIVIYGAELGAAVAAQVAHRSPRIAGLILENPQPSLAKQVKHEQHIHVLPMWLIFPDRFDISEIVPTLKMSKLVIATSTQPEYEKGAVAIYRATVAPKQFVRVDTGDSASLYDQPAWREAMAKFLHEAAGDHSRQSF